MSRAFESFYIALVIMAIIYYLVIWIEQKIGRKVSDEIFFEVEHGVNCRISELIDMEILEPTKKYKDNPEMIFGRRKIKRSKVAVS